MNQALLLWLSVSATLSAGTTPLSKGRWKLADAGCSNPEYKYSPEEKDFIEAIKSGKTYDLYDVADATTGIYETRFKFDDLGFCEGKAKFKLVYPKDGEVTFELGATEWKFVSLKPNVTINCSEDGPSTAKYLYRWEASDLVFYTPSDPTCGNYWYRWKKQG